jgi:hypothetical protein
VEEKVFDNLILLQPRAQKTSNFTVGAFLGFFLGEVGGVVWVFWGSFTFLTKGKFV